MDLQRFKLKLKSQSIKKQKSAERLKLTRSNAYLSVVKLVLCEIKVD